MVYTFLTLVLYVGIFLVDSYQIVHYAGFSIDDLNKSKIIVYCATILASLAMALAFDHSRRIMEKGLIALNDSLEHEKLRAERSLAIKTSFLANMSHEIRTPMNGILGMTSLLRGSTSDPTLVEKIEVIETSGKLLLGIIDDILDFSKLEAGRMSIERIPVQLSQLVRETTSLVRSKAHDNRITIVERISDDLPAFIYCDPVRVKQVLINLLANAIKFSADSSVDVEVVTQSHEGDRLWVQLSVKDRGIGIDRDSQDELFKAFSQADLSTTRKYGGTGLGLALCKRFVELMGGRIWVESEVGCGSTFFFNFPTERVAADIHELTADSLPAVAPVVFPIHILVADDNQINRVVADGILKRIGYQADFAFTGAQALQAASRKTYDIIFMDCHMPEMDGFEATLQIRELPSRHRPFIIALSASVMQEERERCILSGMDKFLAKPLQEKELKAVIKEYAAAHDLQPIAYKIAT
ncbi:MAG TPA: ATP-binding protein [Oligoflexus sp.]|uniref:ATP-binding protein n=1 Tax=Oligoflexus sp. TaxID=1971216 RepID=UPI002D421D76|nr:ATP-binding protein [Oligoflexus sp.]HYX31474.1 ATP-binding protein [Oligoflexus sp.]